MLVIKALLETLLALISIVMFVTLLNTLFIKEFRKLLEDIKKVALSKNFNTRDKATRVKDLVLNYFFD